MNVKNSGQCFDAAMPLDSAIPMLFANAFRRFPTCAILIDSSTSESASTPYTCAFTPVTILSRRGAKTMTQIIHIETHGRKAPTPLEMANLTFQVEMVARKL